MFGCSPLSVSLGCALLCASACGPEEHETLQESPCQVGFAVLNQVLSELKANAPACQNDADCVMMPARVECAGSVAETCGEPVDRRVVEHYDQAQANARFCASFKPSKYGCRLQPACATSRVVCQAGRCVAQLAPQ